LRQPGRKRLRRAGRPDPFRGKSPQPVRAGGEEGENPVDSLCAVPHSLGKWKLGVSLDKNLELRPVTLRHLRQRAVFKIQEGIVGDSGISCIPRSSPRSGPRKSSQPARKAGRIYSSSIISDRRRFWPKVRNFINRRWLESTTAFSKSVRFPGGKTQHGEASERIYEPGFRNGFHLRIRRHHEHGDRRVEIYFFPSRKGICRDLKILDVQIPFFDSIPAVRFDTAKEMVSRKYGRKIKDPYDLEPEEKS